MRITIVFVFTCFFFVIAAQAQTTENAGSHTTAAWWGVYINPLCLIDPLTGTLQVGAERRFSNHIAVSLDYGIKCPFLSYSFKHSDREHYRYYKTDLNIKYFFRNRMYHTKAAGYYYLALRGSFFPQRYRKENDFLYTDDGTFRYEFSDITRKVWTASIVSGHQFINGKFMLNPYIGAGVRRISVYQQPQGITPNATVYSKDWLPFANLDRKQGTFYRPNLVFGITFGYLLSNR